MKKILVYAAAILLIILPVSLNAQAIVQRHAILYPFKKVFQAELFQGNRKNSNYFEGWYFKLVAPEGKAVYALIPGIALGKKGKESHAFIQLINGQTGETAYHEFPISDFKYDQKRFQVWIGKNYFGLDSLNVDVGKGSKRFQAKMHFQNIRQLAGRAIWPGIMGWYRFAPFMETYHGLVSMYHDLEGEVKTAGQKIDFSGGRGYTEKDWGHSFPSSWIWMQSNNFEEKGVSFMCSIANVPWIGKEFPGFLGFLLLDKKVYRFATYTGARIVDLEIDAHEVRFSVQARAYRIAVQAPRTRAGELKAPVAGAMDRRISESLDAKLKIVLYDKKGEILYEGIGSFAGLEIVGKPDELRQ